MSRIEVSLPNAWRPRDYQRPLWNFLENGGKRAVAVWHRRAGKDDVILHRAACAMFERVGNYWHMLPEASQARKAVWDAINPHTGRRRIDEAFPNEIRETTRENEMSIKVKSGSTWQVIGSDNYNSLVGSPPVGIVFSEWALANPNSWAYLRPILAENGGWAAFIYTPRGRNHGATFFESAKDDPNWFAEKLTAYDTSVFDAAQLETELREYQRQFGKDDGESRFRQEYLCDFNVAVMGAYYGRQMTEAEDEGRIGNVSHDKAFKVDTWWDLGRTDATAIWFVQHVGNQIHAIDYHEENGGDLPEFALLLQRKQDERKFVYGRHVWPHDGGHKRLGQGGKSLQQQMHGLGFAAEVQPQGDVEPGIYRVRQALSRCWFDRERCAQGIEALRAYQKHWDEVNRCYRRQPLHNWASHGADAFRTGIDSLPDSVNTTALRRDRYGGRAAKPSHWAA